MSDPKVFQRFVSLWPAGLALFAFVIWLSMPLAIDAVPGGILDHQAAGSAAEVDRIQQAWAAAGLAERAQMAMLGDLVFIVIYGLGAWYGGLWFSQDSRPKLRRLGWLLAGTAIMFLATDLTETLAQLVQLARGQGSDGLAGLAATVRPVKMVAWLVTFFAVLAGLVVRRISPSAG